VLLKALMQYSREVASSPSVLCAISHGLYKPWIDILHSGQEATWLKLERPTGIEVIHFHATPMNRLGVRLDVVHEKIRWSTRSKARLLRFFDFIVCTPLMVYEAKYSKSKLLHTSDPALHIHFPDSYLTYRWKELALFRYFLTETNCEYLFLTSSSSYVNPYRLKEYISKLNSNSVYTGALPYQDAQFVSGSNRILSRDVVEKVLENKTRFDPTIIEDVALGQLIDSLGVERLGFPISNIASLKELDAFPATGLQTSYHFRLKSGELTDRNDVQIMKALHKKLSELGAI
jgi:hypothetical protein